MAGALQKEYQYDQWKERIADNSMNSKVQEAKTVLFFHVVSRIFYLFSNYSFIQVKSRIQNLQAKNPFFLIISEFQIFMKGPGDGSSEPVQEVQVYKTAYANHFYYAHQLQTCLTAKQYGSEQG